MKINKLTMTIIAAASVLAVSPAVRAQSTNDAGSTTTPPAARPHRTMSVDAEMSRIDKAVTLTDAEKPQVKAALEARNTAIQAAREGDQSEMRSKMRTAREDFMNKMKEILTPDQFAKLPQPGRRRGGAGGAGGGTTPPPTTPPAGNQ